MSTNLENSAGATGLETASFHSNPKGQHQRMFILPRSCTQLTLAKQCSRCSQPGFNSTGTINFQMFKLDLEKAEEPQIKLPTIIGSSKKQESSGKTSTSALLSMPMSLTVWITANCGKFWKRWEYQTTWPASWGICMQIRKQKLELDMEQKTCPKSGKEFIKDEYCHPAYLTYMQSTSCKVLDWMKHKLESR